MSWETVSLVGVVLGAVLVGYAIWSDRQLNAMRAKHDAARLAMEEGAIKTFAADIDTLKREFGALRLETRNAVANVRR